MRYQRTFLVHVSVSEQDEDILYERHFDTAVRERFLGTAVNVEWTQPQQYSRVTPYQPLITPEQAANPETPLADWEKEILKSDAANPFRQNHPRAAGNVALIKAIREASMTEKWRSASGHYGSLNRLGLAQAKVIADALRQQFTFTEK